MQKDPRKRDKRRLDAVRAMPCCICGDDVHVEAHHPRFGVGMATKAHDDKAVPLCSRHHRELHAAGNERVWWMSYGIDPFKR